VTAKAEAAKLIRQTRRGYTPAHLATLFGARPEEVRLWIEKGLLGNSQNLLGGQGHDARIPEADVLRFMLNCRASYSLARVHQEWFKALVFAEADKRILKNVIRCELVIYC